MTPETGGTTIEYSLSKSLAALQGEVPTITKDSINPHFKNRYASLETIMETIRPLLAKHGFAWVTMPSTNDAGEPTLKYSLMHAGGEHLDGEMKLMLGSTTAQAQGSALTYARRYSIMAVLGLVADEDDDGNAATTAAKTAPVSAPLPAIEDQVKSMMVELGLVGDKAVEFAEKIVGHTPKTEFDWRTLKLALSKKMDEQLDLQ